MEPAIGDCFVTKQSPLLLGMYTGNKREEVVNGIVKKIQYQIQFSDQTLNWLVRSSLLPRKFVVVPNVPSDNGNYQKRIEIKQKLSHTIQFKIDHIKNYELIVLNQYNNHKPITSINAYETENNLSRSSIRVWSTQFYNLEYCSFPPKRVVDLFSTKLPTDNFKTIDLINEKLKDLELSTVSKYDQHVFEKVYIGYSTINSTMFGLFAKIDLKPFEYIGPYSGELVPKHDIKSNKVFGCYICEIDSFYQNDSDSDDSESDGYVTDEDENDFQINTNDSNLKSSISTYKFAIDASNPFSCFGRYANCPPVGKSNNAYLVTIDHSSKNRQDALEVHVGQLEIKKDDEIFVNYGKPFWKMDGALRALRDPRKKQRLDLGENEITFEQSRYLFSQTKDETLKKVSYNDKF